MNTQGIGLGLVISENIVKAFNGRIGVKSKYGRGTKFAFSIILGKDEDTVEPMPEEFVKKMASISMSSYIGYSVRIN
jgi:signal transduction histidine kinase